MFRSAYSAARWFRGFFVVALTALVTACGGGEPGTKPTPTEPPPKIPQTLPGVPARVDIVAGLDGQSAPAGVAVPVDPTVRVVDILGAPLPNVRVSFTVTGGGGTATPAVVTTDSEGRAATKWTVGPRIGANALTAGVAGGIPPVAFSASSFPILTSEIAPQTAVAGTAAPHPPVVRTTDGLGNPIPGIEITFSGNEGIIVPTTVTTDANGRAAATSWTLPTVAGPGFQYAFAWQSADSMNHPVTFAATVLPGPPAKLKFLANKNMAIRVGGLNEMSTPVVVDSYGNQIPGLQPDYVSSDPSVASITNEGYITGVAPGWTTVKVSLDALSDSFPVVAYAGVGPTAGTPWRLALADDQTALVTFESGGVVRVLDLRSGQLGPAIPAGAHPVDVVVDSARAVAYATDAVGHGISVLQPSTNALIDSIPLPGISFRALLSPDGKHLYVSGDQGRIWVIETATRSVVATFTGVGSVNGLAITRDGSILYAASMEGTVYRLSAADGRVLASVRRGGKPQDVLLSPDESELYSANQVGVDESGGWVEALDATTLQPRGRVTVRGALGLALTPDGNTLAVTGETLTLIDRAPMTLRGTYPILWPTGIAFTSDGRTVMTSQVAWDGWIVILPKP